jgi:dipeptidyl aminopeptidase/acylaminoacyl peptidase
LLLACTVCGQNSQLVSFGIPDSVLLKGDPGINKYRSNVNFPPFIGWSRDSSALLFNGGRYIYYMEKPDGEIDVKYELTTDLAGPLSPDQHAFLFSKDEGGNEQYRLFLYDILKKKAVPVTDSGYRSQDPFWSPDGRRIAYKSGKRDQTQSDLYIREMNPPYLERLVFQNCSDEGLVYDWDPATGQLLFVKIISENNKELYLLDLKRHTRQQINKTGAHIAYSAGLFLPGKNKLLLVSDQGSESRQLRLYDLEKRTFTRLSGKLNFDINELALDRKCSTGVFVTNENGYSGLYLFGTRDFRYHKIAGIPQGNIKNVKFSPDGSKLAFNLYGSTFQKKVCVYDLKQGLLLECVQGGKKQSLQTAFVRPDVIAFPSKDKASGKTLNIPGWLYRPVAATMSGTRSPVLIDVHGGPEYQALPIFNSWYQYLAGEMGITVIVPNIRGSNGYGKTYMQADDWLKRENAIDDIGALLDWIATQPGLDPSRVCITGESYGGYVTLSSLAHYPGRIKCGIDIVGITSWASYLENTSAYRRDLRRAEFGDERIPLVRAFLDRISPANMVDRITTPLFIAQGLNDPRVNYRQSEEMVNALKKGNKIVWYLMARNEGHGFYHPENVRVQQNAGIIFLKKYLLN